MDTQTASAEKLAKMLDRARKLMARADHPNTPKPEAELAREQAAKIIERYRLDEQDLMDSGTLVLVPGFRKIDLCDSNSEFYLEYWSIATRVAAYLDIVVNHEWSGGKLVVEFVGYESDLAIADLLVTECIGAFGRNLEPKYDPSESNEANAWRLRAGGWERRRIAEVLYGRPETVNEMKAANRRVTSLIRQYADRNGLDADQLLGRGNSIKDYRKTFGQAFVSTIHYRLQMMAYARSEGSALVFGNRRERLLEALYERYPSKRPTAGSVSANTRRGCPRCERAKSGYCREHTHLRPAKVKVGNYHGAGADAGRAAAEGVELASGPAKRVEN